MADGGRSQGWGLHFLRVSLVRAPAPCLIMPVMFPHQLP